MMLVTESGQTRSIRRNLVICCDGTNNQFGPENTNVVRLVQVLDRDPAKQRLYYDPGVGTLPEPGAFSAFRKRLSETAGLAFGAGLNWKVQEAYTYLMENWEPGDRVFLFGFSRGAYTVRVLAGLLHTLGLLPRGGENLVPYVMRLFKSVRNRPQGQHPNSSVGYWKLCNEFRWTFARAIPRGKDDRRFPVHFLGVWDTVSSVGWVWDPAKFPYTRCNPSVEVARHAVSVDERRAFFRQNLLEKSDGQDFKEYWFAGVHSDVGGGYPKSDGYLWQEPFGWMRSEAQHAGLLIDDKRLQNVLRRNQTSQPSWKDEQHESLTTRWWPAEFFPKLSRSVNWSFRTPRFNRGRPRYIQNGASIHRTVLERVQQTDYRPKNFPKPFVERVLGLSTPLPETLPFQW